MGKVVEKILEILQEKAEITKDLIDLVLAGKTGYFREARRQFLYGPKKFKQDWADAYRKRQSFYSLLNKLKREGLITKKKIKEKTAWNITLKGIKKFGQFHKRQRWPGGISMREYDKKRIGGVVIVSYDIPEKEKKKRYWLRENLIALDFSFLQKSVWIGTAEIPEEFIYDLREHNLLSHVHIFFVSKRGTIISKDYNN